VDCSDRRTHNQSFYRVSTVLQIVHTGVVSGRGLEPLRSNELQEPMIEQAIRLRAYDLFVQHGRKEGQALDDWLQAEREVQRVMQDCFESVR
jgi:hypothetical protein